MRRVNREPAQLSPGASIAASEPGSSLRSGRSGMSVLENPGGLAGYMLMVSRRTVEEAFSEKSNSICKKCDGCGKDIARFQGYRHELIGLRKTFCRECQIKMNLPVRDHD